MKSIAIGLALGLVFIHSVQAGNPFSDVELINTEHQRWQFRRVTVNHTDTEVTVSGRMNSHSRRGLRRGHVNIAAWSAENKQLIAETTTAYSPRLLTERASHKGGVRFSAKLPTLPVDARIKVALHPNKLQPRQKPVYDQTVAR